MTHEIHLKVSIADRLCGVPPLELLYTQLSTQLVLQTNRDSIKPQASYVVDVVGSDGHLSVSNVEGVSSVPPSLS